MQPAQYLRILGAALHCVARLSPCNLYCTFLFRVVTSVQVQTDKSEQSRFVG